jgi:radical SAM protein with 4Fe4S-binding SPASM domain
MRRLRLRLRRRWAMIWPPHRPPQASPPAAGLYVYPQESENSKTIFHLRVREDGSAELMVNANQVIHLNNTAAYMAWLLLEGHSVPQAAKVLKARYRASRRRLEEDLRGMQATLDALAQPGAACLIHGLDLETMPPFSTRPHAPYRMDLALTYRCNCDCAHCYNARPRAFPELDTEAWQRVIDRLWEIGIPHICFTGGEATLRPDLPQLVGYAHEKGMITGLLSNGRRLSDMRFAEQLRQAGLDHLQITLESHDPMIHDQMVGARGAWHQTVQGIRNALQLGFYTMTNTTLLAENAPGIGETLDFLAALGVPTVGCNALIYAGGGEKVGTGLPEAQLRPLLELVRAKIEQHGQRLIWYTPTQYCHFDPMQLELGVKGCTAARYNMCIEPEGAVIPCQSYYKPLGNILHDPWETIWDHELAVWLRERHYVPQACKPCPMLQECGGGCPLSLPHQQPAGTKIPELCQV